MDPISAALAAGAAAGLTDVVAQAVKDAYSRLKAALAARFPQVQTPMQALEARPASSAKQASFAEEMAETGAGRDGELLQLARALVEAIEREAPQAAAQAGVDLARVKAQFLNIQRVGGGVRVQDAEMTGGASTSPTSIDLEGRTQTAEGGRCRPGQNRQAAYRFPSRADCRWRPDQRHHHQPGHPARSIGVLGAGSPHRPRGAARP